MGARESKGIPSYSADVRRLEAYKLLRSAARVACVGLGRGRGRGRGIAPFGEFSQRSRFTLVAKTSPPPYNGRWVALGYKDPSLESAVNTLSHEHFENKVWQQKLTRHNFAFSVPCAFCKDWIKRCCTCNENL